MKAILDAATAAFGRRGLAMTTDLTLEAMRLARDHPALAAQDWFDRMLFADELGRRGVRAPASMRRLILDALAARNFASIEDRGDFSLKPDGVDVSVTAKGRCDAINRADGICSDFAYIQIFNAGADKPVAKKRFYLRIKTVESARRPSPSLLVTPVRSLAVIDYEGRSRWQPVLRRSLDQHLA